MKKTQKSFTKILKKHLYTGIEILKTVKRRLLSYINHFFLPGLYTGPILINNGTPQSSSIPNTKIKNCHKLIYPLTHCGCSQEGGFSKKNTIIKIILMCEMLYNLYNILSLIYQSAESRKAYPAFISLNSTVPKNYYHMN